MSNLLFRLFIKNPEDVKNQSVRERYGILGSITGIFSNLLLFAIKFAVGTLSGSISIIADAFNNLSDMGASSVSLISFKLSNKPADNEHPFGHGRIEYVAGLIISFLIILVGVEFVKSAFAKILAPTALEFNYFFVGVLIISMFLKFWMCRFYRKIGKRIDSPAMVASGQDSINDVYATLGTLVSILLSRFFSLNIDGYIALGLAIFIIYSGFSMAKETLDPLLGKAVDKEIAEEIESLILEYDLILGLHDLVIHDYGPGRILASVHAEVSVDGNFMELHEVIDNAEKKVKDLLNIPIVIHMDPIANNDEQTNRLKELVIENIKELDQNLSIHDFRIVPGEEKTNLIFDVVVPLDYKLSDSDVQKMIKDKLKEQGPYECALTIDRGMGL